MLEEKIFNTIKRWNMISFNDKILIGVSGGPDSVSLLRYLLSLKKVAPLFKSKFLGIVHVIINNQKKRLIEFIYKCK